MSFKLRQDERELAFMETVREARMSRFVDDLLLAVVDDGGPILGCLYKVFKAGLVNLASIYDS